MSVLLETTHGNLVIDLEFKDAPLESKNFLKLCKFGFYNYSPFTNIHTNRTVQIADPMFPISNTGCSIWGRLNHVDSAQQGGDLKRERLKYFRPVKNNLRHDEIGTVSLITESLSFSMGGNDQRNQVFASSKILITLDENLADLDESETGPTPIVFGRAKEGFDTLNRINEASCDSEKRPIEDIRIRGTHVLYDPFANDDDLNDKKLQRVLGSKLPKISPQIRFQIRLPKDFEELENAAGASGSLDEKESNEDLDEEAELQKRFKSSEAKSQALTLEMIGDLPHADVTPLENILFVCKLNPITQEDDLALIFARFGKVKSCNIVKDKQSGDSLQYGFIEFEEKKSCEAAFLKMDGVLIDDRRIHVDFSQSVWNYRQKQSDKFRDNSQREARAGHNRDGSDRYSRFDKNYKKSYEPGDRIPSRHGNSSTQYGPRHHDCFSNYRLSGDRKRKYLYK